MHILAAVALWGELVAGPHAAGFRTIDAQSASGTYPPKTRAIQIAEYLATHGYVVAFARPTEEREKLPFEVSTPAEKLVELDAQTDDLRGALRVVRELPFVDGDRTAVVTWSYAGESATLFISSGRHGIAALHEDPRAWAAVRAWLDRAIAR